MGLGKEINSNQIFRDEKLHNTHAYINFHNNPQEHVDHVYNGSTIKIKKATISVYTMITIFSLTIFKYLQGEN